jgi:hypothetical protein
MSGTLVFVPSLLVIVDTPSVFQLGPGISMTNGMGETRMSVASTALMTKKMRPRRLREEFMYPA